MSKIVWIIGATHGIGFELLKKYLQTGNRVIASARKARSSEALLQLQQKYMEVLFLVDIDVMKFESVDYAVQEAWSAYGGVDLSIYNAGIYESMKIDSWKLEHFEMMQEVNYMGAVRLLRAITPLFEAQKYGHIAFNISISSYFGLPYGGGYSAPKAALLNLCESIQPELKAKNIQLQVINHGFVKTRLTAKNDFEMPQLLEPSQAAQKIYEGLKNRKKFEIKFPWALTSFLYLLRILPYRFALAITKKAL